MSVPDREAIDELSEMPLGEALTELAASLDELATLEETAAYVAEAAVELVPGCEAANITVRRESGRIELATATSDRARYADELQQRLSEGPCYEMPVDLQIIESSDLASDPRWPTWGPAAFESEGFVSVLSIRLQSARGIRGSLNLYSRAADAFGRESFEVGAMLAVHAAVAVRNALLEQDLADAVPSSRLVGQAQGLLMERFSMDSDAAFAVLRRLSQSSNVKVVEIARRMVTDRTGAKPEAASSAV